MLIDLTDFRPSIKIDLESGIYILPNDSGKGKTYLCRLLRSASPGRRVDSYTYLDKGSLSEVLDRNRNDLVLIDRYDMYFGQAMSEIIEFSKTGIVLVDCKSRRFPVTVNSCSLIVKRDEVVVV